MTFLPMTFLFTLWTFICAPAFAHDKGAPPLSAESKAVQKAFIALKAGPTLPQLQLAYVKTFPKSRAAFLRVFVDEQNSRQLYSESHEYIAALHQAGKVFPKNVLRICFSIGKNLVWEADAIGDLQHTTVKLGVEFPRVFAEETRRLLATEQLHLFRFLADVENHRAYTEYEMLRQKLAATGATDLAAKLGLARERRMKLPHG